MSPNGGDLILPLAASAVIFGKYRRATPMDAAASHRIKRRFRLLKEKTSYLQWNTRDAIFDGINGDNLGAPWGSNPSPPATQCRYVGANAVNRAEKLFNLGRYRFGRYRLGGFIQSAPHTPSHAPFAAEVQSQSMSRCDMPRTFPSRLGSISDCWPALQSGHHAEWWA